MASAHIYHDSIKWRGTGPEASLLLAPRNPDAALLSSADYMARHSVGCIVMATSRDAERAIRRLLGYFNRLGDGA